MAALKYWDGSAWVILPSGAPTGDVSFGGYKATLLANPTNAQDAATKAYVDTYLPIGGIIPFAGSSVPSIAWLICDGTEKAIATYAALYAVLGTIYGALTNGSGAAGTTHFRVPDLRGRSPAGVGTGDAPGATAVALGQEKGEETHTQTGAESGQAAVTTAQEVATHTHGVGSGGARFVHDTAGGTAGNVAVGSGFQLSAATTANSAKHTHTIAAASATTPMSMLGPVLGLNHIIRAL